MAYEVQHIEYKIQDVVWHPNSSNLALWIIALQCWQLTYGNSVTLTVKVKVTSLLGVKPLENGGYSIKISQLTDFLV